MGLAIGANAAPTGATWKMTASVGPSSAVTASGRASVTQKTMTSVTTAANRCASGDRSSGSSSTSPTSSGPSARPIRRRRASKRPSPALLPAAALPVAEVMRASQSDAPPGVAESGILTRRKVCL